MDEQHVFKARRKYNRWVANQTLEDYALRFTSKSARRWSVTRVSNTALGAISFLALEAIGGAITIRYGFDNAITAIMVVSFIIFLTGLPISYYAARYGVDIDLLSRGAGFGYIGSTITSLIYASFTFIFFALEAAIMASALDVLFGLPLSIGYLVSALVIIPLVTHGITFISRFQLWSQPLWLVLQLTPFVFILWNEWSSVDQWVEYSGSAPIQGEGFNLLFFGAASGILFALIAQIGEQVDFLRFLPEKKSDNRVRWWLALISAGPGWIIPGSLKIMAGSFLAVLAINHGISEVLADDPVHMYLIAFGYLHQSPTATLAMTGIFIIICQLKINVTNAYAGSIAWSNFFSRLTHTHPGRVVWLVFNVVIALLVMELGIYAALENILGIYSNVAVAWVGTLVADLVINKPLKLSPPHIEFKRAHLYDINPVGVGAMLIASCVGIVAYIGEIGELAQAMSPYIALMTAFIASPLIAIGTKGRFYIARPNTLVIAAVSIDAGSQSPGESAEVQCKVCENKFEFEDMASCPAYGGAICSLCCTLESRCHDQCKVDARFGEQVAALVAAMLPQPIASRMNRSVLQFSGLLILIAGVIASLFGLVYLQMPIGDTELIAAVASTMTQLFWLLLIIVGVLIWLFVLANESRLFALDDAQRQTHLLQKEIGAHGETDLALQKAKEVAEAANQAKSRYLTGISHELRSPLNSLLGYAQILEKDRRLLPEHRDKVSVIRRSGDHLSDLIEGLLDISRIEAGRIEILRDQVSLQGLIVELIEMFRLQAAAKGIRFEYIPLSKLPPVVTVDEKHLRQILINLLSNAIKYTQVGQVTLEVRYRNQVAEFKISDTGVGIAPHESERIFKPFERIRKPGSPQTSGTGLGLTICKLLSEIMGGDIALQSVPEVGSTFKLSLMLPTVAKPLIRPEPIKRIESYAGKRRTIMVVDDEPTHRGVISEILSPLGFIVFEATGGDECLSFDSVADIDLFLLDISMPGMSGWTLVRVLRERQVKVPIIMVSADAIEGSEHAESAESKIRLNDDYLSKPIRDNALLDKVATALNIKWCYESDTHQIHKIDSAENTAKQDKSGDESFDHGVSDDDCRELISMAELGFVSGMDTILKRMEAANIAVEFVTSLRRHFSSYQFSEIISLCKQAITDDQ
ncbi:ATP-binding protein [Neptunomonas antarctica]|uniref:histidine kinase n=1 Tax=Neptunomonas antarctica TaxID=619304 RepID=A0A1N7J4H6_9GAMM|nr:ATP-binding protein [Neptunomonas antarctica]SIS44262.1 Signal transduction histidine kinase [Neptunomonas antarctica]